MLRKESRRRSTKRFSAILPPPPSPNPENCEAFRNFDIFYLLSSPKTGSRDSPVRGSRAVGSLGVLQSSRCRGGTLQLHFSFSFSDPFPLPLTAPYFSGSLSPSLQWCPPLHLHFICSPSALCCVGFHFHVQDSWLPRAGFLASTPLHFFSSTPLF